MTTFQEPQPQSRRAVRQSERDDSAEPPVGFTQFPPPAAVPPAPQYYANPEGQGDMWDTNARRAAQIPQAPPPPDAAASGRRAAAAATSPTPAAEPLNYSTASRQPSAPSYDSQSFRSRLDARQPDLGSPVPQGERSSYRVRDFSPEGRRAAQAAERAAAAQPGVAPASPSELEYQTEVREGFGTPMPPAPAPISQVPPQFATQPPVAQGYPRPFAPGYPTPQPGAPFQASAPMADATGEQTLSRREMRALIAQEEAARGGQDPFAQPSPLAQPPYSQATQNAPVAWQTPEPVAPPAQGFPQAAPVQRQEPLAQQQAWEATRLPAPPAPSTNTGMTNALAEFDTLSHAQEAAAPSTPSGWTPPVGHWSTQVDLDDEIETTISRRVGSGSSTTNALVLPDIPQGTDIRGPLTSTGEVMLTGSIDLPHSLGSTGTSDRIDHDGIDGLFDLHDHEVISTDSQPVRAIKAVSTHQTGHGVTHTQKPKGTRALTALLISASSLAVVVAGLLVAAFAFNLF